MTAKSIFFVLLAISLLGCGIRKDQPTSIGQATMERDGTIVLDLRAEGPKGAIGEGRLVYPPSHAQYKKILQHLGGLKPGEVKPVPPWE
ncbi:hypothetical protein FBR05_09800 [Deltaproteobacteria bacterium PRO3]|nr:hypothetical protein [Deltaproteobacteria bacterium PRO3]